MGIRSRSKHMQCTHSPSPTLSPAAAISDVSDASSLVTRPFLSRPNAFPPRYEYAESRDVLTFFACFGVVYVRLGICSQRRSMSLRGVASYLDQSAREVQRQSVPEHALDEDAQGHAT